MKEEIIIELVTDIRKQMPLLGGRKLYHILRDDLNRLPGSPGRDKFFEILRNNDMLIQQRKKYTVTTNTHHHFRVYTNLIKDLVVERPNQVFVADITYLRIVDGFCYLFLITDVYSRKIVGYDVNETLAIDGAIKALEMALKSVKEPHKLIHHSDRGIQYCSGEYIQILKDGETGISMGERGNPYENPIAERVNGILKFEFALDSTFENTKVARQSASEAIFTYNELRPHMSINYLTPSAKYSES